MPIDGLAPQYLPSSKPARTQSSGALCDAARHLLTRDLSEIGLWSSFVGPDQQPTATLDVSEEMNSRNLLQAATQIKQKMVTKARSELPRTMGKKYTEVVLSCLTCLDTGATNMFENSDDLYDEDGILVGVAFIEKILIKLDDITI